MEAPVKRTFNDVEKNDSEVDQPPVKSAKLDNPDSSDSGGGSQFSKHYELNEFPWVIGREFTPYIAIKVFKALADDKNSQIKCRYARYLAIYFSSYIITDIAKGTKQQL